MLNLKLLSYVSFRDPTEDQSLRDGLSDISEELLLRGKSEARIDRSLS